MLYAIMMAKGQIMMAKPVNIITKENIHSAWENPQHGDPIHFAK